MGHAPFSGRRRYPAKAGVFTPLGMSATNSGMTGDAGFSYSNQLLLYSRDTSKDETGTTVAAGANAVLMDLNSFGWVSGGEILGGALYLRR